MMVDPEKISRWVERKTTAYLAWDERRTKARREKTLNDHHTLEIAIALCAASVVLALVNHESAIYIRSLCALAALVVFLKFVQLTLIALYRKGERDQ